MEINHCQSKTEQEDRTVQEQNRGRYDNTIVIIKELL